MTKRPIFIGVAAILALGLTAGLAYGAGRLMGTRLDSRTARYEQVGTTRGFRARFANDAGRVRRTPGYRSALRSEVHGWMHDWMEDHRWISRSRANDGYGRPGAVPRQRSGAGSSTNAPRYGHWSDHGDMEAHHSGSWSGRRHGGHHRVDPGHDHCW